MTQLSEIINHNNLDDKLIVFSVPSFFTEIEKKALLNAASISGYKNVKINSDAVSIGLDYGSYKKS
jgi:molecular chaperone DnaK (HSP70)